MDDSLPLRNRSNLVNKLQNDQPELCNYGVIKFTSCE